MRIKIGKTSPVDYRIKSSFPVYPDHTIIIGLPPLLSPDSGFDDVYLCWWPRTSIYLRWAQGPDPYRIRSPATFFGSGFEFLRKTRSGFGFGMYGIGCMAEMAQSRIRIRIRSLKFGV